MSSSRLPGKVLLPFKGVSVLEYLINRISKINAIDEYWIASSNNKADDIIEDSFKSKIKIFRGNEEDVLKRYYDCAKKFNLKNVLRITGDCPLVDPRLVDKIVKIFKKNNFDYVSNIGNRTFADGMDIEIFSFIKDEFQRELTSVEIVQTFSPEFQKPFNSQAPPKI